MIEVMKYFGYANAAAVRKDWNDLSETDREQLKTGVKDGSFNY